MWMIDDVKIFCRYTCPSNLKKQIWSMYAQILEALGQSNEWSEVASGLSLPDLSSRDSARRFGRRCMSRKPDLRS